MEHSVDVMILGEGPAAWVAALAHAHTGRRVRVLTDGTAPVADEAWLTPEVLDRLAALGVYLRSELDEPVDLQGLRIDGGELRRPLYLEHASDSGLMVDGPALDACLRAAALAHPQVRVGRYHRGLHVQDRHVRFGGPYGTPVTVAAERTVLAHDQLSVAGDLGVVTGSPGEAVASVTVDLKGARLPEEGWVHLQIGEEGPLVMRRVAWDRVRLRLFVPAEWQTAPDGANRVWRAHGHHVPRGLRAAVHKALLGGVARWHVRETRVRDHWGRPGLCRVGTAVGALHPLLGLETSLAMGDAFTLAEVQHSHDYARIRREGTATAGLLASVLPRVLTPRTKEARRLRSVVLQQLQRHPDGGNTLLRFAAGHGNGLSRLSQLGLGSLVAAALQEANRLRAQHSPGRAPAWQAKARPRPASWT